MALPVRPKQQVGRQLHVAPFALFTLYVYAFSDPGELHDEVEKTAPGGVDSHRCMATASHLCNAHAHTCTQNHKCKHKRNHTAHCTLACTATRMHTRTRTAPAHAHKTCQPAFLGPHSACSPYSLAFLHHQLDRTRNGTGRSAQISPDQPDHWLWVPCDVIAINRREIFKPGAFGRTNGPSMEPALR